MSRYKGPELIKHHETSTISMHAWNDALSPLRQEQLDDVELFVDQLHGIWAVGFDLPQRLSSLPTTDQETVYRLVQDMKRGANA